MSPSIRVLLADDSPTMRSALRALLALEAGIEVVGEAADGVEAVERAKALRPDVITMDVAMPRLDGIQAVEAIMADAPTRILVVASVSEESQLDLSFRAVAAGALELVAKPWGTRPEELRAWGRRLAESVRLMSQIPVVRRLRASPGAPGLVARPSRSVDAIGIAASTGGPVALAQILKELPGDLPVPLLVAQHIADGFSPGLVRWLAEVTPLRVALARPGEACQPGCVYLPPDGRDLEIDVEGLLWVHPCAAIHRPSGDRLLASLAKAYGRRAGGIVLTGMGDDGAKGLLAIRRAGGVALAQDEATSVVFGMPRVAATIGAAEQLVPLPQIAGMLRELAQPPASPGRHR